MGSNPGEHTSRCAIATEPIFHPLASLSGVTLSVGIAWVAHVSVRGKVQSGSAQKVPIWD